MTPPVSPPSPAQQDLIDLGAQLTPANSLARIDTVTARAVATISVVGTLLTGLGAVAAGLLTQSGPALGLAITTAILAALAVVCALAAQVLTITRHLNTRDLVQVERWYQRQFNFRAYPTQAATVLLLLAAVTAGAAAVAALAAGPATTPTLKVTQTLPPAAAGDSARQVTVTITATFPGLDAGQVATLVVATGEDVLGRAAANPDSSGTATVTLTIGQLTAAQSVTVTAVAAGQTCQASLVPSQARPALTCPVTARPSRGPAGPHRATRRPAAPSPAQSP